MAFGDFSTFAEDLTESTNTLVALQLKLRLTTPAINAGDYRIGWNYTWGLDTITNDFTAIIDQNDGITLFTHRQEPKDSATTQRNSVGGFAQVTLTAGVHTFDIEFAPIVGGDEARIQQARLEFWKVS